MDNTPQQAVIEAKPTRKHRGTYAKPTERLTAAAALMGAGMTPLQAAEHLGYSPKGVGDMQTRIKEKGLDKFLTESRIKTATGVIDTFMKGKPIGRKVKKDEVGNLVILEPGVMPKDTTIKDCAMSVLDREYPKKVEGGGGDTITFTKVDLNVYQMIPSTHNYPISDVTASGNAVDK